MTTTAEITTETTSDRTAALTGALLADGWTYTREVRTDPQWRSEIHELESADGRLHIDASRHRDGFMIARLSAEAVRTDPGRAPGWMADLHEVPLPVALATAKAAADPGTADVPAALAEHGWKQREDITERGRILERAWESPDGTRTVSWFPADPHDLGGWTVRRPGPDGRPADSETSQYTPAAVITALALTDPGCDSTPPAVTTDTRN